MNLIPHKPITRIYDYYCTFHSQGIWNVDEKVDSIIEIRNRLTFDFLFASNGVLEAHDMQIRGDMLVLLDDGWDVPMGMSHNENNSGCFGSMILNEEKFPQYKDLNPYDRLKALSDRIKKIGYAGLGLWVPANHFGESVGECREKILNNAVAFWTERAKMCKYADVKYLKVDWGYHGRDVEYRKLMTDIMKKFSPGTRMEHVIGIFDQPYDPPLEIQNGTEFKKFLQLAKKTFEISDFYRTYDALSELSEATTLMRIVKLSEVLVKAEDEYLGIINVEDNPVIAAALNMSMGIMRHKNNDRYSDVVNTLLWHRIAPPQKFNSDELYFSSNFVCDSYKYNSDPNVWPYIGNKTVKQYAPAVISYNAPLAKVKAREDLVPFVLNSKNKLTGAYCVASIEINRNNKKYYPQIDVNVCGVDVNAPVGIFGEYKTLEICFECDINDKKVLLQNFKDEDSHDITHDVKICGNKLTLCDFKERAAVLMLV